MSGQYPLPSGYPPPGATYGMNQTPPVASLDTRQQLPLGYQQPPFESSNPVQQPETRIEAPAEVNYYPGGNLSPGMNPQMPSASYSAAYIPGEGMQGPSDLPYAMKPGGDQPAQRVQEVNSNPHVYDDPILRAEMEGAAAAQAAATAPVITPAVPILRPAVPVAEIKFLAKSAIDSRPFFLVSELNEKCVLDVFKDNPKPGATVGIYKKKTPACPNQLWYIGADELLHSKLNDLVITSHGSHKDIRTAEISGDVRQQWIIEGNKIVNKTFNGECVTVKKGLVRYKDDAEVMAANYEGKPTQHWKQVYADE